MTSLTIVSVSAGSSQSTSAIELPKTSRIHCEAVRRRRARRCIRSMRRSWPSRGRSTSRWRWNVTGRA